MQPDRPKAGAGALHAAASSCLAGFSNSSISNHPPAKPGAFEMWHALQTTISKVSQETAPTFQVLFFALSDAQDLPKTVSPNADRHQH